MVALYDDLIQRQFHSLLLKTTTLKQHLNFNALDHAVWSSEELLKSLEPLKGTQEYKMLERFRVVLLNAIADEELEVPNDPRDFHQFPVGFFPDPQTVAEAIGYRGVASWHSPSFDFDSASAIIEQPLVNLHGSSFTTLDVLQLQAKLQDLTNEVSLIKTQSGSAAPHPGRDDQQDHPTSGVTNQLHNLSGASNGGEEDNPLVTEADDTKGKRAAGANKAIQSHQGSSCSSVSELRP